MSHQLETIIGYKFKNPELLEIALTHTSYANESRTPVKHNERLEFLGDSVLSVVVADYLFHQSGRPEGELTRMRASLVSEDALFQFAQEIQLGEYLRLGHGEDLGGGRSRPSVVSDAFEAVIAALYLDGGMEAARNFILPFITEGKTAEDDYKTRLQEVVQQDPSAVLKYEVTGETGPAAIGYLYIDADPNNADEMAVLELIKKIEALKPIENLTNEDEAYLRQLLAEYNALTDAQKELVYNYATLLAALEKAGHNPELKNAKPATCTEDGYTGDEVCKVCGEVITKGQVIPATGHKTELVGAKAATCTEDGYTGDEVCTVCGETVKKGETVPATGHHSKKALDGQSLDVVWNLTLATNIISANVQYGQIEKIEKIKGVDSVLIETQYEPCVVKESETTDPNMATSSSMIGSSVAWADGYTGAGSKVAIIDTGADTDHPSLSGAAYSYAVKGLGITPVTAADYADKLEKQLGLATIGMMPVQSYDLSREHKNGKEGK